MFFQAKIVLLTHPVGSHWGMMIRRVWHTESQVCNSNICSWEDIYYYCQQLRGQFTSLLTFVLRYSAWKPTIYPYFEGNQRMRVRPRKKRDVHFTTKMVFKKNDAETTYIWKTYSKPRQIFKAKLFPMKMKKKSLFLYSRTHKFWNIKGYSIKIKKVFIRYDAQSGRGHP